MTKQSHFFAILKMRLKIHRITELMLRSSYHTNVEMA